MIGTEIVGSITLTGILAALALALTAAGIAADKLRQPRTRARIRRQLSDRKYARQHPIRGAR